MRKLKLQVQLSVDGLIAGPNGEMDWITWTWDDSLMDYVTKLTDPVDCIIMGRKMAPGFVPYWEDIATRPNDAQYAFAKKMVDTPKIVFTKTLARSEWNNTTLATGDLRQEIERLKNAPGSDIIVYGGANFVSALMKEKNLIDELHLFINPAIVGKGLAIFNTIDMPQQFKLKVSTPYGCGIVVNEYVPK